MSAIKVRSILIAASIFCTQTSLQANNRQSRLRIIKTALVLTMLGAVGTGAYTFPEAAASVTAGAATGSLVAAGAYHTGYSSCRFIGAAGFLGFGVGAAAYNYIPSTAAADVGYVLTCGTMARLPMAEVADLVGIGPWRE